MAEQGDLPPRFGAVHPRFRTPHVSVLVFAALTWALASVGSFLQNLSLSAVSRLLTYGAVCVAVIVLRRRERREPGRVELAWFRMPLGETVAVLAATLIVGLVHWRIAGAPRRAI